MWLPYTDKSYLIPAKASSAAAATLTGMVALIYDRDPNLTAYDVRAILKQNSSLSTKSNDFGWGVINAMEAVRDLRFRAEIQGPEVLSSPGTYNWSADYYHALGSITSYNWYWNETWLSSASTYSRYVSDTQTQNELKLVLNTSSGQIAEDIIYIQGLLK